MNKDQVKGTAKDIAGKVQEEAGKLTGDKEQQAKGLGKQEGGRRQGSCQRFNRQALTVACQVGERRDNTEASRPRVSILNAPTPVYKPGFFYLLGRLHIRRQT